VEPAALELRLTRYRPGSGGGAGGHGFAGRRHAWAWSPGRLVPRAALSQTAADSPELDRRQPSRPLGGV